MVYHHFLWFLWEPPLNPIKAIECGIPSWDIVRCNGISELAKTWRRWPMMGICTTRPGKHTKSIKNMAPFFRGFTHWPWWFSMVMLFYQRVTFTDHLALSIYCVFAEYHRLFWLVVWNVWMIFPYIGIVIIPTDEFICFRGVETTNQLLDRHIWRTIFLVVKSRSFCCSNQWFFPSVIAAISIDFHFNHRIPQIFARQNHGDVLIFSWFSHIFVATFIIWLVVWHIFYFP